MESATFASEAAKTVPVVIGAALAIIGGIIGQIIAHNLLKLDFKDGTFIVSDASI